MPKTIKLKPCPFCGAKAKINIGGFGEIFASCINNNCGGRLGMGIWFTDKKQAIKVWNQRYVKSTRI